MKSPKAVYLYSLLEDFGFIIWILQLPYLLFSLFVFFICIIDYNYYYLLFFFVFWWFHLGLDVLSQHYWWNVIYIMQHYMYLSLRLAGQFEFVEAFVNFYITMSKKILLITAASKLSFANVFNKNKCSVARGTGNTHFTFNKRKSRTCLSYRS